MRAAAKVGVTLGETSGKGSGQSMASALPLSPQRAKHSTDQAFVNPNAHISERKKGPAPFGDRASSGNSYARGVDAQQIAAGWRD